MLATLVNACLDFICSKWVKVRGESMVPTLDGGQWVRVNRRAYRKDAPRRFDVVLIEHPKRAGFWEVKRIVALPGDRVEIVDGALLIEGVDADDPFAARDARSFLWTLGAGQYVVLGDNRPQSTDSRAFGPVGRRHIVGRVESGRLRPSANAGTDRKRRQ